MQSSDLISPTCSRCDLDTQSKKHTRAQLSELISQDQDTITSTQVFDSPLARERLGGTGVGQSVAIPHGHLRNSRKSLGAFIKLVHDVDYDAAGKVNRLVVRPTETTKDIHRQLLERQNTL